MADYRILPNGAKEWRSNGKLHRLDGPAIERPGGKEWWVDGKRHRLNGPAREWESGFKSWWVNGKLHRLDGPAAEYSDGSKAWYVDGQEVDVLAVFGYLPPVPLTEDEQMILRLTM